MDEVEGAHRYPLRPSVPQDPEREGVSDSGKAHDALRQRVLAHGPAAGRGWIGSEMKTAMQTDPIQLKMREQRLRWFGHVLKRPQSHPTREAMEFEAQGERPRGAPKKRWRDVIKKDVAETKVTAEDAVDRMEWRWLKRTADPATVRVQR
uniref:Uncharacterized protein n=1 Tax=Haemonchus contortus TaxID=6289 RepID=A0A7I4XUK1_HAECO